MDGWMACCAGKNGWMDCDEEKKGMRWWSKKPTWRERSETVEMLAYKYLRDAPCLKFMKFNHPPPHFYVAEVWWTWRRRKMKPNGQLHNVTWKMGAAWALFTCKFHVSLDFFVAGRPEIACLAGCVWGMCWYMAVNGTNFSRRTRMNWTGMRRGMKWNSWEESSSWIFMDGNIYLPALTLLCWYEVIFLLRNLAFSGVVIGFGSCDDDK